MSQAELIPDLPDLSALTDGRLPREVTKTLTDYERSRAIYASQAESLRKVITDQETAEQELSSVERQRKELRQAMQSLSAEQRRDDPRQMELNGLDRKSDKLGDQLRDSRAGIPISESEVERTFRRAEESFQRVSAAFEQNDIQFGKGAIGQAQVLISAGRVCLNQYAPGHMPDVLAAHRRAMDALSQSPSARPATQPAPPRPSVRNRVGSVFRKAMPWNWRKPSEPKFVTVTPLPLQPTPQVQAQPVQKPQRLELQRLEVAADAVIESSHGRRRQRIKDHRNSADLSRTLEIKAKAQRRPDSPERPSVESLPGKKNSRKFSM